MFKKITSLLLVTLLCILTIAPTGFSVSKTDTFKDKYLQYIKTASIGKNMQWTNSQLADLNNDGIPEMLVIQGNTTTLVLDEKASNLKAIQKTTPGKLSILKLQNNKVIEISTLNVQTLASDNKSTKKLNFAPTHLASDGVEVRLIYTKKVSGKDYLCLYNTFETLTTTNSKLSVYQLNAKNVLVPVVILNAIENNSNTDKKTNYSLNGKAIENNAWATVLKKYHSDPITDCLYEVDHSQVYQFGMALSKAFDWSGIYPYKDASFYDLSAAASVPVPVPAPVNIESNNDPIATMTLADHSEIKIRLYPNVAKNTVNNFIALANSGFYNGLTFHRVISGFMIQGGDPVGNGTGGAPNSIKGEFSDNGFQNSLSHTRGVISMARSNDMNSASSQFFIMHADSLFLDGKYAAFGKVISGIESVDKIAGVKTNSNAAPLETVSISKLTIDLNGYTYTEPLTVK
jgi:peptidyl-prolyl cis-trans isomerase B (cyclophilin B)